MASATIRRVAPALAGALALALLAWLYLGHDAAYRALLRAWGIKDWPFPFLDTDTVLSAVRCLDRGIDAYADNPCDPLRRPFDYSPAWMVLRLVPGIGQRLPAVGLAVDGLFVAALLLLPPGRTVPATLLVVAGVLSSATVFAAERGNNDLVLFALVAAGAALAVRRPGARLAGYALLLVAGLLKYYPLATLLVACRERTGRFVAVGLAALALTGLFAAATWHELGRALAIIPTGSFALDAFGSLIVGGRLGEALGRPWLKTPVRLAMIAAAALAAAALSRRPRLVAALDALTPAEASFLMVGSMMILGCFLTAWNIGYRAVHLLLVLPSLLALARGPGRGWERGLLAAAAACCLALLWSIWWRGIAPHPPVSYLTWIVRETAWWFLVTVLGACVVVEAERSPALAPILAEVRRRRLAPG